MMSVLAECGNSRHMKRPDSEALWRANDDPLSYRIIGAAIELHRFLGPGFTAAVQKRTNLLVLLVFQAVPAAD